MKEYKVIWYEGQKQRTATYDDERRVNNLITNLKEYESVGYKGIYGIEVYSREVTKWQKEE